MTDPKQISARLTEAQRRDFASIDDPEYVRLSIGGLLSMALNGFAEIRKNDTVFLTPLGLAVRALLTEQQP